MIGASKILTVSYGTFSCTLEGFDEPFGTMKAIAEYFRELATEDRYFGAEPPAPDAAMLHRIAEREIHRRVEARIEDNNVILRAGAASDRADDRHDWPPAAPAPLYPMVDQAGTGPVEGVGAKLMRVRAVTLAVAALPEVLSDAVDTGPTIPDGMLTGDDHAFTDAQRGNVAANVVAVMAADVPDASAVGSRRDEPQPGLRLAGGRDALADDVALGEGSADYDTGIDADMFDDLADDEQPGWANADLVDADLVHAGPVDTGPLDDDPVKDGLVDSGLADADLVDTVAAEAEPAFAAEAEPAFEDHHAADPTEVSVAGGWSDIASMPTLDDLDADENNLFRERTTIAADPLPPVAESDDRVLHHGPFPVPAPVEPDPMLYSVGLDKIQRARARVISIPRVGGADAALVDDAANSGLTPEAASVLARALSEDRARDEPAAAEPVPPVRPSRRPLTIEDEEPAVDASVSRLIAQTITEMEVPEQRRRRSAIEHLKAAVAATVADRRVGGARPPSEDERADPYRTDLSHVVGPRQVATAERPKPLVLVSEQRIDRAPVHDDEASRAMARSRRSGGSALALHAVIEDEADGDDEDPDVGQPIDPKGFAAFAERFGADNLSDLLEAAAAYTVVIEGRPHFSRPHLMRQVGAVLDADELTRETGLRTFGTLLRTGRVLRVKRGQYALSEDSRYMAEARAL